MPEAGAAPQEGQGRAPPGVVFLAEGFDRQGGLEGQARRLAEGLAAQGQPVLFVTTSPARAGRPLVEEHGLLSLYRVPVLSPSDWAAALGVLEVTALGLVSRRKNDLRLVYGCGHEVGAIAVRVGRAVGLPTAVQLVRSGPFGDVQAALSDEDQERLVQALRLARAVVATTEAVAQEAVELLQVPRPRVTLIHYGVDLARFDPRPSPRDGGPPTILFIGRMTEQKRVDVLIDACAEVRPLHKDLQLVLAGDGPLRRALQVQAERRGMRGCTTFLDRQEDVRALFRRTTLFVQPSVVEGTSAALLEAMASGVPVIAARVPSTEELVRHEREGLLVPPGEPGELAQAIARLLDDAPLGERLAREARARVEHSFSLERAIDLHLELFDGLEAASAVGRVERSEAPGTRRIIQATTSAGLRAGREAVKATARELSRALTQKESVPLRPPSESPGVAIVLRDVDNLGVVEQQALRLARGLVGLGFPVTIISCTSNLVAGALAPRSEERDGATLWRLPLVAYESAAAAILYRQRARLGVVYAVQLAMGVVGARLGHVLDVPSVVKLACGGPWGDIAQLQAMLPEGRTRVRDELADSHVVCLSTEIADEARAAGFAPERLVRIPDGVEVEGVAGSAPVHPSGEDPSVLFVGRLDQRHGVDLLLYAFAQVAQQVPLARLNLVGTGPELDSLKAVAQRLQVADRVSFLGQRQDVWGLMRGATVVALTTRSEGTSNRLLEAMAAGAPIVTSGIAPNEEVLKGGGGLLVPPDDVDAFAHAIAQLLEDPAQRARLSAGARRRVLDYDMHGVVEAHGALFARLAAARPSRPGGWRFASRFLGARGQDLRQLLRRLRG